MISWSDLPTGARLALGGLIAVQVVLDAIALVTLWRTPKERVVGGNRALWAAVILLVSLLGAVLFLVAGRRRADVADPGRSEAISPEQAVRTLYRPRDGRP